MYKYIMYVYKYIYIYSVLAPSGQQLTTADTSPFWPRSTISAKSQLGRISTYKAYQSHVFKSEIIIHDH